MGQYMRKVIADEGIFFVVFDNTIDQFTSKAQSSIEEVVKILGCDPEKDKEIPERNVFDLRSEKLHTIKESISRLKSGKKLRISEALLMDKFKDFLQATVADQQYKYRETSNAIMEKKLQELGLRKQYPTDSWWEIVTDYAMYPAFQCVRFRHQRIGMPKKKATAAQKKLAGWYVEQLACIAGIFGENGKKKLSPLEIVDKFYKSSQRRTRG